MILSSIFRGVSMLLVIGRVATSESCFWESLYRNGFIEMEMVTGVMPTPRKTNGWNPKVTRCEKRKSSSKPSFLGSM